MWQMLRWVMVPLSVLVFWFAAGSSLQASEVQLRMFGAVEPADPNVIRAAVEDRFPNITLEIVSPQADHRYWSEHEEAIAGGEYDLFVAPSLELFGPDKWFVPLNALIDRDKAEFDGDLLAQMQIDHRVYDLPIAISPFVVMLNLDIFDQLGIAVPSPGWSWADFQATAEALSVQVDGRRIRGVVFEETPWFWTVMVRLAAGGRLLDIDRATLEQTLGILVGMIKDDRTAHANRDSRTSTLFPFGQAGMQVESLGQALWMMERFDIASRIRWGVVPLPSIVGGEPVTYAGLHSMGILVTSKNVPHAWEVLKFLSGPDGARLWAEQGVMPVHRSPELLRSFGEARRVNGVAPPGIENLSAVNVVIASRIDPDLEGELQGEMVRVAGRALYGTSTVREVISEVLEFQEAMLREAHGR